ncbi:MAG: hypothetical protein AB7U18_11710 [Dehalococcoidia bacterium]
MRQPPRGLVGAAVGAGIGGTAAAAYFASIVLGPQANEPPSPGFYAVVLAPSLIVPGIGWGAWLGWLVTTGPRPVIYKLIIPIELSILVVFWFLLLAGRP